MFVNFKLLTLGLSDITLQIVLSRPTMTRVFHHELKHGPATRCLSLHLLFYFMKFVGYPHDLPSLATVQVSCKHHKTAWQEKESELMGRKISAVSQKCGWVSKLRAHGLGLVKGETRYLLFVLIVCILGGNVLRYFPKFFTLHWKLNSMDNATTVFLLLWTNNLFIFVASYPGFKCKFHRLVSAVRLYEEQYEYSFDVQLFNSRLKLKAVANLLSIVCMPLWYFLPMTLWVPNFKEQLTPFEDAQGVAFIVTCLAFYGTFSLSLGTAMSLVFPMVIMSGIIRKELSYIAEEAIAIFAQHNPSITELLTTTDIVSEANILQVHSVRQDQAWNGKEALNLNNSNKNAQSISKSIKLHSKSKCISRQDQNTASPNTDSNTFLGRKSLKPLCCRILLTSANITSQIDRDSLKNSSNSSRDKIFLLGINDNSSVGAIMSENVQLEDPLQKDLGFEADPDTLETSFDNLCRRHDTLCDLVETLQDCFCHLYPVSYLFGIVLICFVVYTYANGHMSAIDIAMISIILVTSIGKLCLITLTGCSVNDAAKDFLRPICSSNKTLLSSRLLQKMQFMITRLTAVEVGFHAYGLFFVSRSNILTIVGSILTYILVVVQFQTDGSSHCSACPANISMV